MILEMFFIAFFPALHPSLDLKLEIECRIWNVIRRDYECNMFPFFAARD